MKNIILADDRSHLIIGEESPITQTLESVYIDHGLERVFILRSNGVLLSIFIENFQLIWSNCWNLIATGDARDQTWFHVSYISQMGAAACFSYSGNIFICSDENNEVLEIGAIEGGIAAAQWSPDQSALAIATNNDTIICMNAQWDVLYEVPVSERLPQSPCTISWSGDGETFCLLSVDKGATDTGICTVRIFNRELILTATCCNVATDAAGAVMKGLGNTAAFATNGSCIAIPQQRVKSKTQIALVEKNGLRHGDFDIKFPPVPLDYNPWEVSHLSWDLTSSLLAVGSKATTSASSHFMGCVQLYYRSNYHWYLKQQWTGMDMKLLFFDSEVSNRIYLTESRSISDSVEGAKTSELFLRVVEFQWDVCMTTTRDCTAAVLDGAKVMFTDLGRAIVPPPMSTRTEVLPHHNLSCVQSCSFWTRPNQYRNWRLAALCLHDNNAVDIVLYIGGDNLRNAQPETFCVDLTQFIRDKYKQYPIHTLKSILALPEKNEGTVTVVLSGSESSVGKKKFKEFHAGDVVTCNKDGDGSAATTVDYLIVITIQYRDIQHPLRDCQFIKVNGIVYSTAIIPNDDARIVIGVVNSTSKNSPFSIFEVDVLSHRIREVLTLPEICWKLLVLPLPNSSTEDTSSDPHGTYIVLSLSCKYKLYCDETVLVPGVTSFTYNFSYGMLMFVTLGTRPHLHFCSGDLLAHITANALSSAEEELGVGFVGARWESRPVERGASLVASVPGDSKVIIQLPRGNLEAFEPRPLILLQATALIEEKRYLQCLILLRRQRVDLNFLIDCNPDLFMNSLHDFARDSAVSNAELISLLVSSLEESDVTATKYPTARIYDGRKSYFPDGEKVNTICSALRNELLNVESSLQSNVVNPILCTYAKQRPPLLAEALNYIKEYAIEKVSKTPQTSISSKYSIPKMQASIKYLAFLADSSQLFDAALSACDFNMCRIIARQCQMDPKVYMPLLESFEKISAGSEMNESCPYYCLMFVSVNLHLKDLKKSIDWGMKILDLLRDDGSYWANDDGSTSTSCVALDDRFGVVWKQILKELAVLNVDRSGLLSHTGPLLTTLERKLFLNAGSVDTQKKDFFRHIISEFRLLSARHSEHEGRFTEAATAFLAAEPPSFNEAIQAAKAAGEVTLFGISLPMLKLDMNRCLLHDVNRFVFRGIGDWQWALSIAGRFEGISHVNNNPASDSSFDNAAATAAVSQLRVAQEIVSEFREQLEQGETADNFNSHSTSFTVSDRALEAARICEDYCGDVEGAVSILVLARCWRRAQQIAARVHRADLLEEILSAARDAYGELRQSLTSHRLNHSSEALRAKEKLLVIWKEPAIRLQQVTAADSDLHTLLAQSEEKDWLDTASEYSTVSFRSERSERSVGSGLSSVSVLSTASRSSTSSTYSSKSSATASVFSIEGLDHTLLSRGVAGAGQVTKEKKSNREKKEKDNPRRQKRKEKSRIKTAGSGRDVCGLRAEGDCCSTLLAAAVAGEAAAAQAAELLPLLVLGYGGLNDKMDAVGLQRAVGEFVDFLNSLGDLGPAPAYPVSWLEKKAMEAVKYFQQEEVATAVPRLTWKQRIADIGKQWLTIQKSTLHYA